MNKRGNCFALFLALALAAPVMAETVTVQHFTLGNDEVPVPCNVEELLVKEVSKHGADVSIGYNEPDGMADRPDILITGQYWYSEPNTFLTVSVVDTVNKQSILAKNVFLPVSKDECTKTVVSMADEIANPPHYARKLSFVDAAAGARFVFVPGGSFRMGKPGGRADTEWVKVDSFFLSAHEVTQAQFEKVMGVNPSRFTGDRELPVENVSWLDAVAYARKLSEKTGRRYRLPTEAEWEYAARTKGRNFRWAGTSNVEKVGVFAWTRENSGNKTHPVGQARANSLGLFDMSGNVWEWCDDQFKGPTDNEAGPGSKLRVIRGGSWMTPMSDASTWTREAADQASRYHDNGFRLVLEYIGGQ